MPFANVPEHLQDKMERCVQKVLKEQPELEKENAIAICHDTIVGKALIALTMKMTRTTRQPNGRIRWQAVANTGDVDLENERFDESFFDDIAQNFYLVSLAASREEKTARNLPMPILDLSHYSYLLPLEKRNLARLGWPTKVWRDGRALKAEGYFDNTPRGQLAANAAMKRTADERRVSICVHPDWERVVTDVKTGVRTFKGGAGVAYLDHLAMTANPIDPGAQLSLEDTMAKSLMQKDDALQVLGEEGAEIIDELEDARKGAKSMTLDQALAVIKAAARKKREEAMNENTETDATEATDKQKDETTEEETQEEETTQEPATLSAVEIGPVVADALAKALPKIGDAIDQRLQPLQEAIKSLTAEITVLKTTETEKVKAALDSGGNWFEEMFGNSVQRVKGDAVKGETAAGPQETFGEYAARYGNKT